MARVWFVITVVINIVFAAEMDIGNCNECVRNGANWCNDIGSQHCSLSPDDSWCPDNQEDLPVISTETPGHILNPVFTEKRLYIGERSRLDITYESKVKLNVKPTVVNSTQSIQKETFEVSVYNTVCTGSTCTVTLEAMPTTEFCLTTGGVYENVHVKVSIGDLAEETIIKYLVPCACPCSLKPEKKSEVCSKRGDLICGVCTCHPGWFGEFCDIDQECLTKGGCRLPIKTRCKNETKSPECNNNGDLVCDKCNCHHGWSGPYCGDIICAVRRGDLHCTNTAKNNVECSGNGVCGPCDTCICYTDREGSQYFDEENGCSDICMMSSDCDACLSQHETVGECVACNRDMTKLVYNETLIDTRDKSNRKVWVKCNEIIDNCSVEYYAMKNDIDQIQVMIVDHCNNHAALQSTNTKVPIIFGVLGILAAVMAIAGIVVWKHFNAVPPLPLTDPEYQNIDAEDCTGENPLYKSPMSSFKNPTYGKCY